MLDIEISFKSTPFAPARHLQKFSNLDILPNTSCTIRRARNQLAKSQTQLGQTRRRRSSPRPRHLLCPNESRQYAPPRRRDPVYTGLAASTCVLAGLEWSVRRSDILC